MEEYARQHGHNPDTVLVDFKDYWLGAGKTKMDWRRVWMTWCRRQKEFKRDFEVKNPAPGGGAYFAPIERDIKPGEAVEILGDDFDDFREWYEQKTGREIESIQTKAALRNQFGLWKQKKKREAEASL